MEAKFDIKELLGIGFTLLVLAIGMAYGLDVMEDVQSDMTVGSTAYNATGDGITGVAKIPSKIPTIATVILASMIIGILVTYLWARFAR